MAQVLVVDDDAAIRGLIAFALEAKGFQVSEAASANEAISSLQNHLFDVVLLDMGMPPFEHTAEAGEQVLQYLSDHFIESKVIVLTGQSAEDMSYLAVKYSAFDFFSKPIELSGLENSINRALLFAKQEQKLKADEGLHKIELDLYAKDGMKTARNAAEGRLIREVWLDSGRNVHEVARRLNLKRENVYYLLNKYGLERS